MKKITLVFVGHELDPDLHAFGLAIGGKFRNAHLVDPEAIEPCDFVAGHPIPDCYAEHPRHPQWSAKGVQELLGGEPLATLAPQEQTPLETALAEPQTASEAATGADTGAQAAENGSQGNAAQELVEIEVTRDYLASLDEAGLLELAAEEGIELTKSQKKTAESLREAVAEHYGI